MVELTFGERAVGLAFNPSGDKIIWETKKRFADLIDKMHELRTETADSEQARLASVTITELQGAQMWAVKALTWSK